MIKEIIQKIQNKESKICIVGLGYVGLPLAINFAKEGFKVTGLDTDSRQCELINKSKSPFNHISNSSLREISNKLKATSKVSEISKCDVIIVCLPTPLDRHRQPDLSIVKNSLDSFSKYLKKGQAISFESTTYPGTTEEVFLPKLLERGLKVGSDFFLIYSPEREDPGNELFALEDIPKVCAGYTKKCLEVGLKIYSSIFNSVVEVSSLKVAEMTKLLENIHRSVNIGLVNEMKLICDPMDININEVITAAATKPFGFVPYRPGPGLGGHCIPIDPFYLSWKAKEFGLSARFIELAGEINIQMPDFVIKKVLELLNEIKIPFSKSKILILGVAYKKNVGDTRESPSISIIQKLLMLNAQIQYYDPYVNSIKINNKLLKSIKNLTSKRIQSFDLTLLLTDHDEVNYKDILKNSSKIIDTRNVFEPHRKVKQA